MLYDRQLSDDAKQSIATTTVGVLLGRIVLEIDEAAETLNDMQAALSPILMQADDPSVSAKAQGIDLLEQVMRDLSVVVAKIAGSAAAAQPLDAATVLDQCKLANVARRLHGLAVEPLPDAIEFF